MRSQLGFMKQTGMTATEAHTFQEQFLGEAAAYTGRLAPGEQERLQTFGAQYATTLGGDVAPRAQLYGRLLSLGGQNRTAEQIVGEAAEVNRLLEAGSGETDRLTQSLLNASASMVQPGGTGSVRDIRSLAALAMGASRLGSPSTVDTTLMQFARAAQGQGTPEWGQFVRGELGVQEGTKVEDAMVPLFDAMRQAQAQGRALPDWLKEKGLTQVEQQRAVIGMFGQGESMLSELRGPVRATAETARAQVGAFYADPLAGGRRLDEANLETARIEAGMRQEERRSLLIAAQAEAIRQGRVGPEATGANAVETMIAKKIGDLTPDERVINEIAEQMFEKRTGQRFERTAPGFMAQAAGWAAMGLPRLAAGAAGMFDPAMGRRMTEEMRRDQAGIEGRVQSWQGVQANDLQENIVRAQGLRAVGGWDQSTLMWGPRGRTTVGEFERSEQARGTSQAEIAKKIADALQRGTVRPLVAPSTGKTPTR
jgi:hypothetical protein